ncbi:hypothetical protein AB0P21_18550 [Kribbella sp. NPDC056861]|uniref:hypothetical protein n=1 Tax=Kribbella sp. NPDC056861 TaxID=3154857 RepID=UPI00343D7DD7
MLLDRAADFVLDLDAIPTTALLDLTLEQVTLSGGGPDFRLTSRVISSAEKIINRLQENGRPVTDLLLSLARYHAAFANGGDLRRKAVERARDAALDDDELLRALLVLARVEIDTSNYRKAAKLLAACGGLPPMTRAAYRQQLLVTSAMVSFYDDVGETERLCHLALDGDDDPPRTVIGRQQPRAEALHYLGRVAKFDGRHQEALDFYLRAQEHSEGRLTGRGFHHVRMAEVLMSHDLPDEIVYHLSEARRDFQQGQEASAGEAQLDATYAAYLSRQQRFDEATEVLTKAKRRCREHNYPRGELQCIAQLAMIEWTRRRPGSVIRRIGQAGVVFLRDELAADWRHAGSKTLTDLRFARDFVFPRRGRRDTSEIHCPCGADHRQGEIGI